MAYIFHHNELPRLLSVVPGRERVFFASKELHLVVPIRQDLQPDS